MVCRPCLTVTTMRPTIEAELAFLEVQMRVLRDSGPPHLTRERGLRLAALRARRAVLLAQQERQALRVLARRAG